MSNTTQVAQIWSNEDVEDLMTEVENLLGMMEPYYSQCGGGNDAEALLERLRAKQDLVGPFSAYIQKEPECSICGEKFTHSVKKKLLSVEAQRHKALDHMTNVHGLLGKDRYTNIINPSKILVEFENRKAYKDFIRDNPHLA